MGSDRREDTEMRTGYAIRDKKNRAWLATRTREDAGSKTLTVWVKSDEDAMIFKRLPDAKQMLKAVRQDSRTPEAIVILDPRWGEVD